MPPVSASSTGGSAPSPAASVAVVFKLDYNIDSLPGGEAAFKVALRSDIATALSISIERVVIVSVAAGSVVAEIQFNAAGSTDEPTPNTIATQFVQQSNNPSSSLYAQTTTSKTVQGSASIVDPAGSGGSSSDSGLMSDVGGIPAWSIIVIGGGGLLLLLVGICLYRRRRPKRDLMGRPMSTNFGGSSNSSRAAETELQFGDLRLAAMSDQRVAELANV